MSGRICDRDLATRRLYTPGCAEQPCFHLYHCILSRILLISYFQCLLSLLQVSQWYHKWCGYPQEVYSQWAGGGPSHQWSIPRPLQAPWTRSQVISGTNFSGKSSRISTLRSERSEDTAQVPGPLSTWWWRIVQREQNLRNLTDLFTKREWIEPSA